MDAGEDVSAPAPDLAVPSTEDVEDELEARKPLRMTSQKRILQRADLIWRSRTSHSSNPIARDRKMCSGKPAIREMKPGPNEPSGGFQESGGTVEVQVLADLIGSSDRRTVAEARRTPRYRVR